MPPLFIPFPEADPVVPEWSSFVELGTPVTVTGGGHGHITALTHELLMLADTGNNQIYSYTWDGETFTQRGSQSISSMGEPAIAALSASEFVQVDNVREKFFTFEYDITTHTFSLLFSTDFPPGGPPAQTPQMVALTDRILAVYDTGTDLLRRFEWKSDGFDRWEEIGNSLAFPGSDITGIAALTSSSVVVIDGDNRKLYKFDIIGDDFVQDGSAVDINDSSVGVAGIDLAALSETDVAVSDVDNNEIVVFRFENGTFNKIGAGFSPYTFGHSSITAINHTDIVLYDLTNARLQALRGAFGIGPGPNLPPL